MRQVNTPENKDALVSRLVKIAGNAKISQFLSPMQEAFINALTK